VYLAGAVEEDDPRKAAGNVAGAHSFVMRLLIHRPGIRCGGPGK
jgi:hypothetical protein